MSITNGTKGISESLVENLRTEGFELTLTSKYKNKIFRIFDIVFSILLFKGNTVHIDVFSGSAFRISEVASYLAKKKRKRIIFTLHGGRLEEFSKSQMQRVIKVFNRADVIQTPSNFLKVFFESYGVKLNYLPNSIDINKFPYSEIVPRSYSILWVRAFTSIYNPLVPIYIVAKLKKIFPQVHLSMIGPDKGMLDETLQIIDELNLKSYVSIIGPVPNEDLYKYYNVNSVFLNTTSYESFGVAVMEAAACGIPIISNNVGELPFIWENQLNILFVKNNDIDSYVNHITDIFNNESLALKLKVNARNNAQLYSWNLIKPLWVDLFNNNK